MNKLLNRRENLRLKKGRQGKTALNYAGILLLFIATPFFMLSCGGGVDTDDIGDDTGSLFPSITSISPESGMPGTVVTITGTGFGTDPADFKVRFITTDATNIISVTDTEIEAEVPAGFSDQAISVRVFVSGKGSNTVEFYYESSAPPVITNMTATCFYHSTVVITGTGFSLNKEENTVKFGEVEGTVTEATRTSLTVTAPDLGAATGADVTVTKFGELVSNAVWIDVEPDQNKVATYDWISTALKPGVTHKTGTFTLFGETTRRIHVLDVTLNESNTLGIGLSASNEPSTFRNTVTLCNENDAVAGINAGYFEAGGADKDPYIRINGTTMQAGHTSGVSVHFANAALLIHNNVASVRRLGTSGSTLNQVAAAIPVAEAENIIVCGPMLIIDGVIDIVSPTNSHNTSSVARTGLGVAADGRVIMVTVDHNNGANGVTTEQLAKILQALGAVNAMNFDGGGSTTMFVKDHGTGGLVNLPSGGVQRNVRSVVYVK